MTPEERKSIFADVQARSKAAKEKRRKGMAATIQDTIDAAKSQPEMAASAPVVTSEKKKMSAEKKGVIGAIKKRKDILKKSLDY